MNAALLVLSSALATGGDIVPAGWGEGPIVTQGAGCSSCGSVAPSCGCSKPSFLDKLKARFAPKPKCGCAPAPTTCNLCEAKPARPTLLDKLRSLHKKPSCGCAPAYEVPGCATPGTPVVPPAVTTPPKDMPKPTDAPKKDVPKSDAPKGNTSLAAPPIVPPAPPIASDPVGLPSVPLAPVPSAATKTTGNSPY